MKILLISDEESSSLWDHYQPEKLEGYDLIISCGDLKPEYLSFLVTMGKAPLLYVHGNHDVQYDYRRPDGCICIEDRIVNVAGLRILGLGGSAKYSGGPYQFSERQMRWRIWKLWPQLLVHGGVDMIVTHAPVRGYGDDDDLPHRGFEAFWKLLERYHPRFLVHGHVHLNYGANRPREVRYGQTRLINAFERYTLDLPEYEVNGYLNIKEPRERKSIFDEDDGLKMLR